MRPPDQGAVVSMWATTRPASGFERATVGTLTSAVNAWRIVGPGTIASLACVFAAAGAAAIRSARMASGRGRIG